MKVDRVLVATDLSAAGNRAVQLAVDVARREKVALSRLAGAVDPARQLELSTGVVTGPAARKIAHATSEYRADMLVIGAHGEHETTTGQPGLGGTATKLVRAAPCALRLVRLPPQA